MLDINGVKSFNSLPPEVWKSTEYQILCSLSFKLSEGESESVIIQKSLGKVLEQLGELVSSANLQNLSEKTLLFAKLLAIIDEPSKPTKRADRVAASIYMIFKLTEK